MKRPRVLLADDHTLVADGLRRILEPECEVVGAVEDGRSLLVAAEKLKPDIILLDISMPLLNGVDAARRLRDTRPRAKVIFVTMHADATYVAGAFRAGASGYVLKRCASMELLSAIHEVLKGRPYVAPLITKDIVGELSGWMLGPRAVSGELTDRQREVVQLVAEGRSIKEIAVILKISGKTVTFHKSNVMRRLGIRTTAELTKYALEHGITGILTGDGRPIPAIPFARQDWTFAQFPGLKSRATFELAHLQSCAVPERSRDEPAFPRRGSADFAFIRCRFCIAAPVTVCEHPAGPAASPPGSGVLFLDPLVLRTKVKMSLNACRDGTRTGQEYGHLNEQLDIAQTGFEAEKLEQDLRYRIVGQNEAIERTSRDDDTPVFFRPRKTIVPLCCEDRPIVANRAS